MASHKFRSLWLRPTLATNTPAIQLSGRSTQLDLNWRRAPLTLEIEKCPPMQTINRLRWFHRLWNESYLVQAPTQNRSSPHHFLTLPSLFWKRTVSLPARTLPKQSIIIIIHSSTPQERISILSEWPRMLFPMAFCLQWPSWDKTAHTVTEALPFFLLRIYTFSFSRLSRLSQLLERRFDFLPRGLDNNFCSSHGERCCNSGPAHCYHQVTVRCTCLCFPNSAPYRGGRTVICIDIDSHICGLWKKREIWWCWWQCLEPKCRKTEAFGVIPPWGSKVIYPTCPVFPKYQMHFANMEVL